MKSYLMFMSGKDVQNMILIRVRMVQEPTLGGKHIVFKSNILTSSQLKAP